MVKEYTRSTSAMSENNTMVDCAKVVDGLAKLCVRHCPLHVGAITVRPATRPNLLKVSVMLSDGTFLVGEHQVDHLLHEATSCMLRSQTVREFIEVLYLILKGRCIEEINRYMFDPENSPDAYRAATKALDEQFRDALTDENFNLYL